MKQLLTICLALSIACVGCRYQKDASDTLFNEMKASTLLKKYEWFKDAAAQLDKKQADIAMYESMVEETKKDYGPDQSKWPRDVRETQSQRKTEMLGVKSSYNSLAAEYNAAMAKINYEFCNVGDLPRGATKPLPRAFKPYETK